MRFFKSVLLGIAAAFIAAGLCFIAELAFTAEVSGAGGLGAVSAGAYYFQFAAVLGFAAGFYWQFRRGAL